MLLAGMEAPTISQDYREAFHDAFITLAREYREIVFMPFLLEGVAGDPALNQADGIHPNKAGAASSPTTCTEAAHMIDAMGGGG